MSVCLSVRSHKETPIHAESGPKPLPTLTCIPHESIADTHTSSMGQLSGSTEPCALSYATQSHRGGNRLQTIACARVGTSSEIFRKLGYIASIVRSPSRSMARSTRLANGVTQVVARRSQTVVQGRFRLQGLDPMGVRNISCGVSRQGRFLLYSKSE